MTKGSPYYSSFCTNNLGIDFSLALYFEIGKIVLDYTEDTRYNKELSGRVH